GDGASNRDALDAVRDGRAAVCFAAPERFASQAFRTAISRRAIALFVVDEALGHPPVMACTATATPKVAEEIVARLGLKDAARVRSGFDRPNLSFDVLAFD